MMSGQELYNRYKDIYQSLNVEVDAWRELEPIDQEAWNQLASGVEAHEIHVLG